MRGTVNTSAHFFFLKSLFTTNIMGITKSTPADTNSAAPGDELRMTSENKPQNECNTINTYGIPGTADDRNSEAEQRLVIHSSSKKKPTFEFTKKDIGLQLFSIATTLFDVGSDIYLSICHGRNGDYYWFALTLFFVFMPCLVQGFYSLMFWWIKRPHALITTEQMITKLIPGGPVVGNIKIIILGCRYRKYPSEKLAKEITQKIVTIAFVRHGEAFIEAAPQLVLQLYILLDNPDVLDNQTVAIQLVTVITSLCALSWSSVALYKSWVMRRKKEKISLLGLIMVFVWNTFTISARVLSLVLFAISTRYCVLILSGIHFIIMLVWHLMVKSYKISNINCYDFTGSLVKAFVMIFSLCDRFSFTHTRLTYALFHLLMYFENSIMLLVWYYMEETSPEWLSYLAFAVIIGLYWVGVTCQVLYYLFFHPNNSSKNQADHIKPWVPLSELACIKRRPNDKVVNEVKTLLTQYTMGRSEDEIDEELENIILSLSSFRGEELQRRINYVKNKLQEAENPTAWQ